MWRSESLGYSDGMDFFWLGDAVKKIEQLVSLLDFILLFFFFWISLSAFNVVPWVSWHGYLWYPLGPKEEHSLSDYRRWLGACNLNPAGQKGYMHSLFMGSYFEEIGWNALGVPHKHCFWKVVIKILYMLSKSIELVSRTFARGTCTEQVDIFFFHRNIDPWGS